MNVWLALAYAGHPHHVAVRKWFDELTGADVLCFCRVTQMSFLRLLTNRTVMGAACRTQQQAWEVYDALVRDPRVTFLSEPAQLEANFRRTSARSSSSLALWTDDYLAAFAESAGCTLATLDRDLAERVAGSVLPR